MSSKPKIFVYATAGSPGWFIGQALAEDGTSIGGHASSSISFAKHDMGITSDWKHEGYKKHYPDGYELEWIEEKDLKEHAAFNEAFKLNQAQKEDTNE